MLESKPHSPSVQLDSKILYIPHMINVPPQHNVSQPSKVEKATVAIMQPPLPHSSAKQLLQPTGDGLHKPHLVLIKQVDNDDTNDNDSFSNEGPLNRRRRSVSRDCHQKDGSGGGNGYGMGHFQPDLKADFVAPTRSLPPPPPPRIIPPPQTAGAQMPVPDKPDDVDEDTGALHEAPKKQPKLHHLTRHFLPPEGRGQSALVHLGVQSNKEAESLIKSMSQRELRTAFQNVYGSPTSSFNNSWLRRKLFEAVGVSGGKPIRRTKTQKRAGREVAARRKEEKAAAAAYAEAEALEALAEIASGPAMATASATPQESSSGSGKK